jgi:sugar/nucleoside kinase (ribokinase family)
LTLIGHITRDLIRIGGRAASVPGGTVHYAGVAYARLGAMVNVLTKLAPEGASDLTALLRESGCSVQIGRSRSTTEFENALTDDLQSREQHVSSVADPFEPADMPLLRSDIVHLGPLTSADMDRRFLQAAAERSALLVLDIQGCVRRLQGRRVVAAPWPDAAHVLPLCQVIKADLEEASIVTGLRDPASSARALHALGAREVLLTLAERGSWVASADAVSYVAPVEPHAAVDSTGAGDSYTAGYVFARLQGAPILTAARFAAAVGSLAVEGTGPFTGTVADVEARLAS